MVEIRELSAQLPPDRGFGERIAVGRCSQREPLRDPGAEQRIKLAERGGLPTDRRDVLQPNVVEPADA
jgi:hypothetical protein